MWRRSLLAAVLMALVASGVAAPLDNAIDGDVAQQLNALSVRATRQFRSGQQAQAIATMSEALHLAERTFGLFHPETAQFMADLADLYASNQRLDEARPLYERALWVLGTTAGPHAEPTVRVQDRLAALLDAQGEYLDAAALHERSTQAAAAVFGEQDWTVALYLNLTGESFRQAGALARARTLYERAIAILKAQPNPEEVVVLLAGIEGNLAVALVGQGEVDQATPLAVHSLEVADSAASVPAQQRVAAMVNLALVRKLSGELAVARELLARARPIAEVQLGIDAPDTINVLLASASLHQAMGHYRQAVALSETALQRESDRRTPSSMTLAIIRNHLGNALSELGERDRAREQRVLALALLDSRPHVDPRLRAVALNNLAISLRDGAEYAKAEQLLRQALAIGTTADGPDHPATAQRLANLADLLLQRGNYAEAQSNAARALAITVNRLGATHPAVAAFANRLGDVAFAEGRYRAAEALFERARIASAGASGAGSLAHADALGNLGRVYRATDRAPQAIAMHEHQRAILESIVGADSPALGPCLNNLGLAYRAAGRDDHALVVYRRALTLAERELGPTHPDVATTRMNLASLLSERGAYGEALALAEEAVRVVTAALGPTHPALALLLDTLASIHSALGDHARAEVLVEQALRISRERLGEWHVSTGKRLNNLALAQVGAGHLEDARASLERALAVEEHAGASNELARSSVLFNLGVVLGRLGRPEAGEALVREALGTAERQLGEQHPETGKRLNALAGLSWLQGRPEEAEPLFQRALSIALVRDASGSDPELLAQTATDLCVVSAGESAESTPKAIYYCKIAVGVRQGQRRGAATLSLDLRQSLSQRVSLPYALLAQLLSQAGRVAEAEDALLLLKDEEYAAFTRGPARGGTPPIELTPVERQLADEVNALARTLAQAYATIEGQANRTDVPAEEDAASSRERRDALQQQLLAKLRQVAARLQPNRPAAAAGLGVEDTHLTRLVRRLSSDRFGEPTVVLSYVVEARVTTVLITGPSGPSAIQLPFGSDTLDGMIDGLRLAIRSKQDYRPMALELDRRLIAPVQDHLRDRGLAPQTLMLYLTGRLRYLPFATLVDAHGRHLVERYRLAVLTAAARDRLDAAPVLHWSVTGFGSTRALPSERLAALPAVKEELDGIVRTASSPRGALPGRQLLDADFSRAAWQRVLEAEQPASDERGSVVHLATHFRSRPGDWSRSFLLFGTGERYEISELSNALSANLDGVDLITLSACATELTDDADGQEFEGLGALFQRKGARAVIGTLWPVQDEGASALMTAFYSARGEERRLSKAAALQDAQVRMLRGDIRSSSADLTHPYYWAPFVLMGNWL